MSGFNYEKDADGIVTVTMDMAGPVNSMSEEFLQLLEDTAGKLEAEEGLTGVVLTSAKKTFFAGGDLNMLCQVTPDTAEQFFQGVEATKAAMRRLEKLPVPVAAAINGAALGGGLELALACNHRVVWNDRSVQLGFPEVTLGLLPGGGGVVKAIYLMGLMASNEYLLEGKRVAPAKALESGLIDATVDTLEELVPAAKSWIMANREDEAAMTQPWDTKGYKIPGGNANTPAVAQMLPAAAAMLQQKTRGLLPAPAKILDIAVAAMRVDFETAMRIESRGLTYLALTPQAKNMINTFFFQMNQINGGASRPADVEPQKTRKVGVLGAGMMGQGIAYVSAMAGIEVILKDISQEAADKGKAYTEKLVAKRVQRGRMTEEKAKAVLGLITPTASSEDLQGCDLIIEAVFENIKLKHQITEEMEGYLAEGGVWGSNTSTLPITELANASTRADQFIGIHFFSPVEKMFLVEIIRGQETGDRAVAKALDYVRQIRKTPIVVNDARFFYANRCIIPYINEGIRMVAEGVSPALIDNAARMLGFPVGPLQLVDETSIDLGAKIARATKAAMGNAYPDGAVDEVIFWMEDQGRMGRKAKAGFFAYDEAGKRQGYWDGLADQYPRAAEQPSLVDVQHRLMFVQALEAVRALEEGVLMDIREGDVGAILGWGFAPATGGPLSWLDILGSAYAAERCDQLVADYGDRFTCPDLLRDMAAKGQSFYGRFGADAKAA